MARPCVFPRKNTPKWRPPQSPAPLVPHPPPLAPSIIKISYIRCLILRDLGKPTTTSPKPPPRIPPHAPRGGRRTSNCLRQHPPPPGENFLNKHEAKLPQRAKPIKIRTGPMFLKIISKLGYQQPLPTKFCILRKVESFKHTRQSTP